MIYTIWLSTSAVPPPSPSLVQHDRVYSIWSRMVLEAVSNLAVIGGDAAAVVPTRLVRGSISLVCINFPEPPHHSGASV